MADTNGTSVEVPVKEENSISEKISIKEENVVSEEGNEKKPDLNGGGDNNAIKRELEEKKPELSPESLAKKIKREVEPDIKGGGDNNAIKQEPEDKKPELSPEVLAKKIKRQIEYYFGDYNLPTDKFLRAAIKEKDGWVSLATLLTFNRLSALTKDADVVINALQGSQLIQISEDKKELRRNPDKPLPVENEARRKEILTRTVYVKGFPQEGFTMDSALDFFEQFGNVDDVVMRFWQDKAEKKWKFKGSVFIRFPTKEAAQQFLDLPNIKFEDTDLIRMWQEEYIENKRKERLDQKILKRKHPEGQQDSRGTKKLKIEEDAQIGLPKNATLHMTKCPPEGMTREFLKEKVEALGVTVAFINYDKGDEEGWIRLHEEGTASKVIAACEDGVLKLKEDVEVALRQLEGEEESKFLETARQSITSRRAKGKQRGKPRGYRGQKKSWKGKGGGNWHKRKHEDSEETEVKMEENSSDEGD